MAGTEWTTEPPTEVGHYWWRPHRSLSLASYEVIYLDWNLKGEALAHLSRLCFIRPEHMRGEWWPKPLKVPQ